MVTLIATGFMMIFALGGFGGVGASVHVMTVMGLVMASIFGFIVAVPFPRVADGRGRRMRGRAPRAALTQVRRLVGINLVLGLVTITIAILGHGVV